MISQNSLDIIFLHGAWHGPECWRPLLPYLNKEHKCYTPCMPGRMGEAGRVYRKISLHDYIHTVERLLNTINKPVYLVAHSLAGLVATSVASKFPGKVKGIIYLAAYIPKHGQSMFDLSSHLNQRHMADNMVVDVKKNQVIFNPSTINHYFYNDFQQPAEATAKKNQALNPEPLKAFTTPVEVNDDILNLNKYYLATSKDNVLSQKCQQMMIAQHRIRHVVKLKTDHCPFMTAPVELAKALNILISKPSLS